MASCSDDVVDSASYLDGKGKTPIEVSALLDKSNGSGTRAVDKAFDKGDELIAYLRHVTWDGGTDDARTSVDADKAPLLVTFTKGSTDMTAYSGEKITPIGTNVALGLTSSNTQQASDLTASTTLYWDDFSNSASADTDLRTDGHYLQSYYGYCYNGGTPTTALTETTGVLGWTVASNQTDGFKTSDLLWSYEQTPVRYSHATQGGGKAHGEIVLPYTHAMSKVTIEVVCGDGFDSQKNNFSGAKVVLKAMNTVAEVTAPTGSIVSVPGTENANIKDITMQPIADGATNVKKSFAALITPTEFNDGLEFAEINSIDGNNYTLKLTDNVLNTSGNNGSDWASKLTGYTSATKTGTTQPGVNYLITVTINKQKITVKATIKDWDEVSAEGVGKILFENDIDETGVIADALKTNGFDLYKSTTKEFGTKATTISWSSTESKWEYSPTIYWQNKDDKEYFRALSGAAVDNGSTADVNESLAMTQGQDVLWGTTPKHSGTDVNGNTYNYTKGAQIDPRTGNVPLEFEHAMSKISVILKSSGDNAVTLTDAKVEIINTYNEGKIDLNTGDIADLNLKLTSPDIYTLSETVNSEYKLLDQIVIPQSLVKDNDGATRNAAPTFYQSGELTLIYNDGTSLPSGGGSGTYYQTSSLDRENYAASDLTAIYADGTSIDDGSGISTTYETATLQHVDQVLYSQDEIDAAKAIINAVTDEVITTAAAKAGEEKTPAVTHPATEEDVANGKAQNVGDLVIDIPAVIYTQDEIDEAKAKIAAVTDEVRTTAAATAGDVKIPEHYKLQDGSIQANEGDFHYYKTNDSSVQHTPGELKSAGSKIMLYVTLTDGTRYSIELSKCKVKDTETYVTEWKRGEHYTYEITLGKEEITFRALVKDWVEKSGSGEATLDWD